MDTNTALPDARELYNRWREARETWEAERVQLALKIEGVDQMIDGLLKIYPELRGAEVKREVRTPDGHRADLVVTAPDGSTSAVIETKRRAGGGGRLTNAILDAVGSADGWVTVKDVMATLEARDALPDGDHRDSTVRSLLRRAHQDGLLVKDQVDGRTTKYRLAAPKNAESPAATGLSVTPNPVLTVEGGEGDDAEAVSDRQDHVSGQHDGHHRNPSVTEG